jgi:protein gp37
MNKTPIEWCRTIHADGSYTEGYSSNPVYVTDQATGKRGWHCVHQDATCDHCYAEAINKHWGTGKAYIRANDEMVEWHLNEAELRLWEKLDAKIARQGLPPARVFVGDMLDLFHPDIPGWMLDRVFAVAARCPHLILMFLSKQARRMQAVAARVAAEYGGPLPHVWWGVSCALRKALWRVQVLCETPAAVRFVSYEPALELVDFRPYLTYWHLTPNDGPPFYPTITDHNAPDRWIAHGGIAHEHGKIDWLIWGGESGPRARPFDPAWARTVLTHCQAAGVAVFGKQMGSVWARAHGDTHKGGDPAAWDPDLRVREFPATPALIG